jgi:hypothetical protein
MKNRYFFTLGITLLLIQAVLFLPGCSTTEEEVDSPEYELNVIVNDGVTGTPAEGSYTFNEGDTVDYSYQLQDNYKNLLITLDNEEIPASGTITITGIHNLKALADPIYTISGNWAFSEDYDDGSIFEVTVTFSGSTESGTVTDSDGGRGVYTVNENNIIEFNLDFDDISYEYYDGIFSDGNNISGICKKTSNSDTSYGQWSATRITASVSTQGHSRNSTPKGRKKN